MPALLFSLQYLETVWGVGLLEVPEHPPEPQAQETKATIVLTAQRKRDISEVVPQPTELAQGEFRGNLLLTVEWTETGANLQMHSVQALTIPVSRLYELQDGQGTLEKDGRDPWLMQIWGSPSVAQMSESIPFCRMGLQTRGPLLTEAELFMERRVELQWPESWSSLEPVKETPDQPPQEQVATKFRHAMFEGSSPSDATARSLKHWAEMESWFFFGPLYARYDDELLPIDEATALHPNGELALTPLSLKELREDQNYIACHASVVRFILLSWGWDVDNGELLDADGFAGQGWVASGAHAWRLRHLCLSCWLLGQTELRQSCNDFVLTMGSAAPWSEDGHSEAEFTLGRYGDRAAVEAFWELRLPPSCPTKDERTLIGILLADDNAVVSLIS